MEREDPLVMLAGPVRIHPRVLEAMATPSVGHRTAGFRAVNREIRELLRYAFDTDGSVALLSGSGTAGLEAMLANLLRREDRVLCLANGKFGERAAEMAGRYGRADVLASPWGQPVDLDRVRSAVETGDYRALVLCHNETSTAVTNQAAEVGSLAREAGLLYLLDGITSVAGMPVEMAAWGIDAVVLGSQKCLAAPAGLSAVALSDRGYDALHEENGYYLNLKAHVDRLAEDDTPWTPAIHLFLAFREALRLLREEGLEARIRRTERLGRACRDAGSALGLDLLADPAYASNTVTAFQYPPGVDDGLRSRLREEHRILVAGGQGSLKGRIFRIGHMGICSFEDLLATFEALTSVLEGFGVAAEPGAARDAIVPHRVR